MISEQPAKYYVALVAALFRNLEYDVRSNSAMGFTLLPAGIRSSMARQGDIVRELIDAGYADAVESIQARFISSAQIHFDSWSTPTPAGPGPCLDSEWSPRTRPPAAVPAQADPQVSKVVRDYAAGLGQLLSGEIYTVGGDSFGDPTHSLPRWVNTCDWSLHPYTIRPFKDQKVAPTLIFEFTPEDARDKPVRVTFRANCTVVGRDSIQNLADVIYRASAVEGIPPQGGNHRYGLANVQVGPPAPMEFNYLDGPAVSVSFDDPNTD
jgi:hypothetical protein